MTSVNYREQLYDIFAETETRPEEKIQQGLEIGTEYLDLPIGYATHITDGTQQILTAVGDHSLLQSGNQCPLEEAYCRRTIETDQTLAVQDADASADVSQPAVERFDLGTYIGAKVTVEGESYGTLCFADRTERDAAFSEKECYFVELFARLVGQAIERRTYERELEQRQKQLHDRNQLISVLNRVLRHNLRNELNVIIGQAERLCDRLDQEEADIATQIIETGHELVHTSETARRLETTLNDSVEAWPHDIVPYVRQTVTEIDEEYPAVSIQVQAPETAVARANENLKIAVQELIENAAKHGGDSPSITVTVTDTGDSVTIRVQDDGPGLPQQDRDALLAGEETDVVHGSGLGLWLVNWIITRVDGTLRLRDIDTGACIEIKLQPGQ